MRGAQAAKSAEALRIQSMAVESLKARLEVETARQKGGAVEAVVETRRRRLLGGSAIDNEQRKRAIWEAMEKSAAAAVLHLEDLSAKLGDAVEQAKAALEAEAQKVLWICRGHGQLGFRENQGKLLRGNRAWQVGGELCRGRSRLAPMLIALRRRRSRLTSMLIP